MKTERIVVKTGDGFVLLAKEDILWMEADGECTTIRRCNDSLTVRKSISTLEQEMDARLFYRINRSLIVNIHHIRLLKPWQKGEYVVLMNDGTTVHWTRKYRSRLEELLRSV